MSAVIAPLKVTGGPAPAADYSVALTERTATVRYRSRVWPEESADVARIDHIGGQITTVAWGDVWRRLWSPALRVQIIGRVQHLLIERGPYPTASSPLHE
jgi:hypothetical protein